MCDGHVYRIGLSVEAAHLASAQRRLDLAATPALRAQATCETRRASAQADHSGCRALPPPLDTPSRLQKDRAARRTAHAWIATHACTLACLRDMQGSIATRSCDHPRACGDELSMRVQRNGPYPPLCTPAACVRDLSAHQRRVDSRSTLPGRDSHSQVRLRRHRSAKAGDEAPLDRCLGSVWCTSAPKRQTPARTRDIDHENW